LSIILSLITTISAIAYQHALYGLHSLCSLYRTRRTVRLACTGIQSISERGRYYAVGYKSNQWQTWSVTVIDRWHIKSVTSQFG